MQDRRRLRELDVAVVDDLHLIAPRVEEVEATARTDLDARSFERFARRFLVIDDQTEVTVPVRRLRSALRERDELVAHVDERHPRQTTAQLELEDPAVEVERVVDALDLERDMVDPDRTRHSASVVAATDAASAHFRRAVAAGPAPPRPIP